MDHDAPPAHDANTIWDTVRGVCITGVGMISSAGVGRDPAWAALLAGETGTQAPDTPEAALVECPAIAPVGKFRAQSYIANRKSLKLMTRAVRLGMVAARMAWDDAALADPKPDPERFGVFVGAGQAFADSKELQYALTKSRAEDGSFDIVRFGRDGLDMIHPLWLLRGLSNNVLGFASLEYNAQGINNNYCNSGVSGMQAIIEGAHAIAEGRADVILAGGYDSVLGAEALLGYGRLGLLARGPHDPKTAHRPFDAARTGMVPGEGACFVVMESVERAKARGAAPFAHILGGGVVSGAYGVTDPDPGGAKLLGAVREALRDADADADAVGAIFAHGAASTRYDPIEAAVYREVFGARVAQVRATADKAVLGHTVAAAGALSTGVACCALRNGQLPPVANLDQVGPDCQGPAWVTGAPAAMPEGLALVTSAGLGGQAGALLLSR